MTQKNIDFFIEDTLNFALQSLEPDGKRILEVGCGSGEFGLKLKELGAILTAIDTDANAIKLAKDKGIDGRQENIISFQSKPFDIIIFTRSLHHIHNLEKALEKAWSLLRSGGKLLIEDFDLENVDYKTTRWYYDTLYLLNETSVIEKDISYIDDPLEKWQQDHHHEPSLNTGSEMLKGVEDFFVNIEKSRNPYLFRSICGSIKNDMLGYNMAQKLRLIEEGLIKDNSILPNGLRIIAQKRNEFGLKCIN